MKSFSIFLIILLAAGLEISAQEKYSKVKINIDEGGLNQLIQLGVGIDHGEYKKGRYFISDFSDSDIEIMSQNAVDYEILIDDVVRYYQERNKNKSQKTDSRGTDNCDGLIDSEFQTPNDFTLGSMGGFYTYQEFLNHLDTMFAKYPNLISQKQAIDTFQTHEGRPVYWLRMSDNPNIDETEPEILYTAVHHAREPASLSQVIMYMYYLLENYGSNDEVTNIVNNTEMYFIPMVNPDGYIENYNNSPNGGGMWRKNKRNNGNGTSGVDLNRNYGEAWGLDDNGSSPDPSSDTYRGPGAFSEPETQAVKYFTENREIALTLNYHTYGNLLIYPWGYAPSLYTPDSAIFVEYAKILTENNSYTYGTGDQTVGYVTNGDSDDWMYGEQSSKPKILSFTPEAGDSDDGFWPPGNRIETISKSNLRQNLNLANLVGKYARVTDLSATTLTSAYSFIDFKIRRLGLDSPATFTVSIDPVSPEIISTGNPVQFTDMSLLETRIDSIFIQLDSATAAGQVITFVIKVDNGNYFVSDTITKTFGSGLLAFSDNGSSIANWNSNDWGLTTTSYYSPSSSITDSPNGDYQNNTITSIQLNNTIALTNAIDARLSFWGKWSLETGYDYAQVMASSDNGVNWTPLCGKYTKTGNSSQDLGNPVYNGFQLDWVKEEINLNDFLGSEILIRFRLETDVFVNEDGYYFDDIEVSIIGDSTNTSTAISEYHDNSFNLYPNPGNGIFTLENNSQESITFNIFNTTGQLIYQNTITATKAEIDLSSIPKGIYFLKINDTNDVRKIIVQ